MNNIELKLSRNKNWSFFYYQTEKVWYAGDLCNVKDILLKIKKFDEINIQKLKKILLNSNNKFGLIFKFKNRLICCTDTIRSYPIFYSKQKNKLLISNDPKKLFKKPFVTNNNAIIDCLLSGYTHGRRTLHKNIHSMLAAEIIFLPTKYLGNLKIYKYFLYNFTFKKTKQNLNYLSKKLDIKFNKVISKLIKKANGRQIVVPLSGGLDSRLILCKLHEFKYKNIVSFTYGLKNNSDVKYAKIIAESLDINWKFIPFEKSRFQNYYNSSFKNKYDLFADHYLSLPNYQDVFFLKELLDKKFIEKKSIVVNGQTGDFITGGQIPINQEKKNFEYFNKEISLKHFFLFNRLSNSSIQIYIKENLKNFIKDKSLKNKNFDEILELWNFEERQTKYIINGQRAYEFMSLDWFLPFWDNELIKFWNSVPYKFKVNQMLYKHYLRKWNYKSLFEEKFNQVHAFTGIISIIVRLLSIFLSITEPLINKRKIISFLDYYSRYGYMYNFFSLNYFLRYRSLIKNAFALHTLRWLLDRGLKSEIELLNKKYKFLKK